MTWPVWCWFLAGVVGLHPSAWHSTRCVQPTAFRTSNVRCSPCGFVARSFESGWWHIIIVYLPPSMWSYTREQHRLFENHWNRVSMVSWIPFDFSRLVMVVFFALLPVRNFHDCIVGGGCKTGTSVFWGDSKVWKCRHKALFGAEGVGWVAGSP